jgi:hypothetical protein
MYQLRLKLADATLAILALGQVAHKAGEQLRPRQVHLPDGELHGKCAAVLAPTDDDATDTDDVPFACRAIACQVAVVLFPIRRGHQHADILARDLLGTEAEQALSRDAEGPDQPLPIDHD